MYELGNDVCVHVCHLEHVPVHSYVDEGIRVHSLTGCSSLCIGNIGQSIRHRASR